MIKLRSAALAASLLGASAALAAQGAPATHRMVAAHEIVWGPAPPNMPAGAKAAILYGDPAGTGLFAMRLKAPKGYTIPPHTHARPEIVTVISGTVRLGMGSRLDPARARPLPAGSFYSTEPGTAHFVIFDEDAIIQVNSSGPWGLDYLSAARPAGPPGACLMQGAERLRATPLRAVGTEPFWSARIEGRCVNFSRPGDERGTRIWTRYTRQPNGGTWSGALGGRPFELRTRAQPGCSDGMSDKRYPLAVELLVHGERRKGCAEPL